MRYSMWLMIFSIVLIAACSGTVKHEPAPRKVFEGKGLVTDNPGMNSWTDGEPGETAPLPRGYEIAPPVIPHSIVDFEISRDANDCIDCHLDGEEFDDGHVATKIPASHKLNSHNGETVEDGVMGIRYNCVQCHVAQTVGTTSGS